MPPVQIAAGDDTTCAKGLLYYNAAINATNTPKNHVPLSGGLTTSIMMLTSALMVRNVNINVGNWSQLLCV